MSANPFLDKAMLAELELKPYARMKDSGVEWLGDVPAHWETRRLRNLVEMRTSNVDKHVRDGEQAVRLCNYVDVYKHDSIGRGIDFMTATATADEIDRFKLVTGDVLITKDSEDWTDIGVPAVVEGVSDGVLCGYHLALLRPRSDCIRGKFLLRALQTKAVATQLHCRANGVTRYGLSQEAIKSTWLPVPPLPEQAAIARFLDHATDRIDRYIRAKEKLIGLLDEQKQTIINEVVTGQIDVRTGRPYLVYKPSGVEWLGAVPAHWDVRPAKWHFREIDERSDTGSEELLSVSHLTGVTPRSEKNVSMFEAASNVGHKVCVAGDLVINTMWAWMAALGMARQAGIVSPSYAVYRPINESPLCRDYAELMLRSTPYQSEYKCLSSGIRPSRLRLYPDVFLRIKLICPPPKEQSIIIDFVNQESADTDHAVRLMRKEIATLKEYSACLIADVITGKLDVRDATAKLPDTEPLAGEHGAHTGGDGPNSHDTECGISEEVNS